MNKNVLNHYRIKTVALFVLSLLFSSAFLINSIAYAEVPPVPKPRPKIVHVSPEYIKKLIKDRQIELKPVAEVQEEKQSENKSTAPEIKEEIIVKENVAVPVDAHKLGGDTIKDTTKQEVLEILDQKKSNVPKPQKKPVPVDDEQTTISFALKSKDIALSDDIVTFLRDHTLRLLSENPDMALDINAYATPIDNEKNSAIRVSLARSLEVRKWLMENGVSPSRLKLNTNREQSDIESDDRIDLILHH